MEVQVNWSTWAGRIGCDGTWRDVTGRDGTGRVLASLPSICGVEAFISQAPQGFKIIQVQKSWTYFLLAPEPPNKILGNSGGSRKWPHFSHFCPERCQNSLIIVLKIRGIQTKSMTAMTLTCFKFQPILLQDVARRWCSPQTCHQDSQMSRWGPLRVLRPARFQSLWRTWHGVSKTAKGPRWSVALKWRWHQGHGVLVEHSGTNLLAQISEYRDSGELN